MSEIYYLLFFLLGLLGVIGIFTYSNMRIKVNFKKRINSAFGKPPTGSDYELASIETYYNQKSAHTNSGNAIDDTTWDDLEMDKFFKRINVCLTSTGEECLYDSLHYPLFEESKLLKRETFISFLKEQPDERYKIQLCLAKLGKSSFSSISSLIYNAEDNLLKYPYVYKVLSIIPIFCVGLMLVNINIGVGCLILSFIINMIMYYLIKRKIEFSLPAIKYFSSVLLCCNKLCKIESIKDELYFAQLEKLYSVFKSLAGKVPNMKAPVGEMEIFAEYIKILFLVDIRNYNKLLQSIIKQKPLTCTVDIFQTQNPLFKPNCSL